MFPRTDLLSAVLAPPIATGMQQADSVPQHEPWCWVSHLALFKTECSGHEATAWDICDNPKAATTHRVAGPVNPSGSGVVAAEGQRQPSVLCVLVAAAEQERAAV